MGLPGPIGCEDLVVHQHHDPGALCAFAEGRVDSGLQVHRAVCRERACRSHGARDHHRQPPLAQQVEYQRAFFQRVGAMGDHNAAQAVVLLSLTDTLAQEHPVAAAQMFAAQRKGLFDRDVCQALERRQRPQ